jgi:excisionase family DNA binding protein
LHVSAIAAREDAAREILTANEVAARLRVSRETVRRLILSGDLPAARVGAQFRFHADDVERLLKPAGGEAA